MITVTKEADFGPPYEKCVFCSTPTPYWTSMASRAPGEEVACCPLCARSHQEREVPTKEEWCKAHEPYNPGF